MITTLCWFRGPHQPGYPEWLGWNICDYYSRVRRWDALSPGFLTALAVEVERASYVRR